MIFAGPHSASHAKTLPCKLSGVLVHNWLVVVFVYVSILQVVIMNSQPTVVEQPLRAKVHSVHVYGMGKLWELYKPVYEVIKIHVYMNGKE